MKLDLRKVPAEILENSQKGQDSFIQAIFSTIGATNKYYVEFGGCDGIQMCNTSYLRNRQGWEGLMLDSHYENLDLNLHQRKITKDNICDIFKEFDVPLQHDFLSIDIDGCDYWIAKSLLREYKPRVIMIETCTFWGPTDRMVLKYDEDWYWDGTQFYGASPLAVKEMLEKYGYTTIHLHQDDLFAIRSDIMEERGLEALSWEEIYPTASPELYYPFPNFPASPHPDQWEEVLP